MTEIKGYLPRLDERVAYARRDLDRCMSISHHKFLDGSSVVVHEPQMRSDRWIVRVHDSESKKTVKIEILNNNPEISAFARGIIGYNHTPGKIANLEIYQDDKKQKIKNPVAELETEISSALYDTRKIIYGEPEKEKNIHEQAWQKLRGMLFT